MSVVIISIENKVLRLKKDYCINPCDCKPQHGYLVDLMN